MKDQRMIDGNCYFEITEWDEFKERRDEKYSVIDMLGNPYSPDWMPQAIFTAIEYSDIQGDNSPVFFALNIELTRWHYMRENLFIRELIKEINRVDRITGEYCLGRIANLSGWIFDDKEITLKDLKTMQKRLKKSRVNEFRKNDKVA